MSFNINLFESTYWRYKMFINIEKDFLNSNKPLLIPLNLLTTQVNIYSTDYKIKLSIHEFKRVKETNATKHYRLYWAH